MDAAQRQIDAFILPQHDFLTIAAHNGGAGNHHPMLGAMKVFLQGKLGAGANLDLLHLETLTHDQAFVMAPGAIGAAMFGRFLRATRLQPIHQLLHILRMVAMQRQHGIICHHHHGIFQPDHTGQDGFAPHIAILRIHQFHRAESRIAGSVLWLNVPERGPGTDIGPANGSRHHGGFLRAFHHRVINADGGCCGEGRRFKADEIAIARGAGNGSAHTLQHLRRMGFQLGQHGRGGGDKHAGIP